MEPSKVHLLPHNEEAFIKLDKCLKDNQLVAINHATGTGKSFIILKYLYENKDKRILFMSPSYPINDQLIQEHMNELDIDVNEFKKINTMIYRNLLDMDMEELASQYDIIVLDEYHRCGAKKWGIKVNELLKIIKEKYPQTKVIGTTATEIRYLDNEKNMNNILFDGVCASTLTLADAMLKEILPVPIYISTPIELNTEYEKSISKVYNRTLYDVERNYYLKLIEGVRNQIDEIVNKEANLNQYIKKDGKHLVFSSTIDNIKKDRITINQLLNYKHNEYVVHSRNSKEKNTQALKQFRYDKSPATLYCINILNEGVHVKGVDSIFMLRPTTSPIIFFQQLGRLLSYSRRKDKVVVFDLVNNIRNSPHIYKVYRDVYKRAGELIETDPTNKDRYLKILKSFKIVDATSEVYEKLDTIKKALTKENFYKKRIDFVIDIIQGKAKANEIEMKLAKLDLFKYYKYITLEQYKIIKNLDINKPAIFNLSEEEFITLLNGAENIYQKEKKFTLLTTDKLNNFYKINGYFPSILSKNKEEVSLAKDLINLYTFEEINESIFENKKLNNLTEYEKIVYKIGDDINVNLLYKEIDKLIANNINIYPTVLQLLQSQKTDISRIYLDKIFDYNTKKATDKINTVEASSETNSKMQYTKDYTKIAKECMVELQNYKKVEDYLKQISDEIISYITKNKTMPTYYSSNTDDKEIKQTRRLYVKKIIFYDELKALGYIDLFEEVYNSIQMEIVRKNKKYILEKLVEFLENHNGDMPSTKIEKDKSLAQDVNKIKKILETNDLDLINLYRKNNRTREVILKYVDFVKKNKRYPLLTTDNDYEREVLNAYLRNEPYFNEGDKKILRDLKKSINSKEAIKNAYAEMLKQRKRR